MYLPTCMFFTNDMLEMAQASIFGYAAQSDKFFQKQPQLEFQVDTC